jgi:hypothetical protein
MNPIVVFLVCAFVTALTLCVASLITGSGLLYNVGAVIAVTTAVTAMWATAITELNNHPKEEDQ